MQLKVLFYKRSQNFRRKSLRLKHLHSFAKRKRGKLCRLEDCCQMMSESQSESVLLTDGEYYNPTIDSAGANNPYMADALKVWLKKGHDVLLLRSLTLNKIMATPIIRIVSTSCSQTQD